jgi:hypothetical protein
MSFFLTDRQSGGPSKCKAFTLTSFEGVLGDQTVGQTAVLEGGDSAGALLEGRSPL